MENHYETHSLDATYDSICALFKGEEKTDCLRLEPIEHVREVERLRQLYRPQCGKLRLLLLAESHVVVSDLSKGVGFIYEPRYYTPWWHDLILPGFGADPKRTTADLREKYLTRLRDEGFWLLDISIIALSGYRKVERDWPNRPFDMHSGRIRKEFSQLSWDGHVRGLFLDIVLREAPVVAAFESVTWILPSEAPCTIHPIKFRTKSNNRVYRSPDYKGGTHSFKDLAERAGLEHCLRGV